MTELNNLEIGARIKKRREDMGLTQEALAEALDVSVKFVSDIENGAKGMSLKTLNRLSQTLLVSADHILFGTGLDNDLDELAMTARMCPPEKRGFAAELLRTFVRSHMG